MKTLLNNRPRQPYIPEASPTVPPCPPRRTRVMMRFPVAGHVVTIVVDEETDFPWSVDDIDAIQEFLEIWRKCQTRKDRSNPVTGIPAAPEYYI